MSPFCLEILLPVDINGIGYIPLYDVIVDSRSLRGLPFTLNGYPSAKPIPAEVSTGMFSSFITVHENGSYLSYPIPTFLDEDRYWLFEPRDSQKLKLVVNSDPPGAEVFIDGFRTGFATPAMFGNISDGPHRIMVVKPGYLPQQRLIDLPRYSVPLSATTVDFYLEEYPSGFLYVNSTPEGCTISIDGLPTGEVTPALFRSMPTGLHSIAVNGPNRLNDTPQYHDRFPEPGRNIRKFHRVRGSLTRFLNRLMPSSLGTAVESYRYRPVLGPGQSIKYHYYLNSVH